MTLALTVLGTSTFVLALVMPLALHPWLRDAGVMDVPNHRSSHSVPAIRGAGITQAITLASALIVGFIWLDVDRTPMLALFAVTVASAALGWIEDYKGLRIGVRAVSQFVIGLAVVSAVAAEVGTSMSWGLIGGLASIGLMNVVNFMDGINGISSIHAMIAGTSFAVIGFLYDLPWMIAAGVLIGAAFGAFLPWNFRGRAFLGDVGSYLLGGVLALLTVMGWMAGAPIVALVAPMAIYLADTATTLAARIITRQKWYEAHRDHTYQRLHQRGISHIRVAMLVGCFSAAAGLFGILSTRYGGGARIICLSSLLTVVAAYSAVRAVVNPRRRPQLAAELERE